MLYSEGGEALALLLRAVGAPSVMVLRAGQLDLVRDSPAHGRGLRLGGSLRSLPTQAIL